MAIQALYRKWRSQTFEDVIGQQHITQTLQNAIQADRVGHAYLFTGPRGTGKTSTARILAKAINCTGEGQKPCNECSICQAITEGRMMDMIEIDAASNTSVDDIRDLRDKVGFRPGEARMKFYIIDEVHMLSKSAFNALLKTLEEPPDHVIFVLATTEPEKIPATIMSRCQRFDFRRINVEDIAKWLRFILENEQIQADDDALTFIARQGGGSMRDAISLLDQLTAYGRDVITLDLVHSVLGAATSGVTKDLVDHLFAEDVPAGLALINNVIGDGVEPKQFTLEVLEYLRGLMLIKYGDAGQFLSLSPELLESMKAQAGQVDAAKLLAMTGRFNQAVKDFKLNAGDATIPQLPLELAFVESVIGLPAAVSASTSMTRPQTVSAPAANYTAAPPKPAPPQPHAPPSYTTQAPAKQPASSPQPVEAQPADVSSLTKESLRERWPAILAGVGQKGPSYQGYLKRPLVQDVDIQGDKIIILFGYQYRDAAKRVDKHKNVIIDVFKNMLGKHWQVEFRIAPQQDAPNPAPVSAPTQSGPPAPSAGDPADDELIKAALDMGGQIKS